MTLLAAAAASRSASGGLTSSVFTAARTCGWSTRALLRRNAEHLADHGHRQRQRECRNDVDFSTAIELVEQLVGEAHDVGAEILDRLGCERLGDEPAQSRVIGRIEAEHRGRATLEIGKAFVPLRFGEAVALPHRDARALPETGIAQDQLAVVVTTDHDEARTRCETPAPARGSRRSADTDPTCPRA